MTYHVTPVAGLVAVEAMLASLSPHALLFAEAYDATVEGLQNELSQVVKQMEAVQSAADAEKRALTDDEDEEIGNLSARFDAIAADIERRNLIANARATIERGTGRRTDPDDLANHAGDNEPAAQRPHAGTRRTVEPRPRDASEDGRHGFRSFGEFAMKVRNASHKGGPADVDTRLRIYNTPSTYGTEGTGADGGFAVPPDFRREIMQKVMGEESLISRTMRMTTGSNTITIPKNETTSWQTSGGVQAAWENEASQLSQSKPALDQTTVRLNKLTALVLMTEELLEDAPAMSSYLMMEAPRKMDFKLNDAIVNGTGAGQPLGILNAPALVTVDKESGQAADSILFANITNMWSRLDRSCRANAVWLVNQDIEPQLYGMAFPGTGTAVPVYLPPGGLSSSPYSTLMGRPVIPTDACDTLGDVGDIILGDLRTYLTATKVGGIRQDVSMHLFFDYDMTAFRFIFRVGGQPWWSAAITPKNSLATRSCFVTLAARG